MNRSSPPTWTLRAPRGQISWVTLLLLVALGGGGYLATVWGPVYVVHYEVKQVVRDYMNQAIKNPDDTALVEGMTQRVQGLAKVDGLDEYGRPAPVPAIDLSPSDVTWERYDDTTPTLHVSFDYVRTVQFPFLDRRALKRFHVDLTNDLTVPQWAPAR